jgi:hypothetical protein
MTKMIGPYDVTFQGWDLRIVLREDNTGEYKTFEQAKGAAIDYLEVLIGDLEETLEQLRAASSFEEYVRADGGHQHRDNPDREATDAS